MAYTYILVANEDKPFSYIPGTYWIKPSVGLFTINLGNDYHHIARGKGNLVLADGVYYRTVTESTEPVAPSVGDIWLQNNNTYWVYLGYWTQFGGG